MRRRQARFLRISSASEATPLAWSIPAIGVSWAEIDLRGALPHEPPIVQPEPCRPHRSCAPGTGANTHPRSLAPLARRPGFGARPRAGRSPKRLARRQTRVYAKMNSSAVSRLGSSKPDERDAVIAELDQRVGAEIGDRQLVEAFEAMRAHIDPVAFGRVEIVDSSRRPRPVRTRTCPRRRRRCRTWSRHRPTCGRHRSRSPALSLPPTALSYM